MASYSYFAHVTDDEGYVLAEVEVSYEAEPNSDLSGIEVSSITVPRDLKHGRGWVRAGEADLLSPDVGALAYTMGIAFKSQIEADPDAIATVFEDHGLTGVGGSNDPGSDIRRVA